MDIAKLKEVIERLVEVAAPEKIILIEAGRLTRYAVVNRYPGIGNPVTDGELEEAVAHAERVVR